MNLEFATIPLNRIYAAPPLFAELLTNLEPVIETFPPKMAPPLLLTKLFSKLQSITATLSETCRAPPLSARLPVKFEPVNVPLRKYTAPSISALLLSNEEFIKSSSSAHIALPLFAELLINLEPVIETLSPKMDPPL